MSGGVVGVRRDGVKDFMALRQQAFDFELAPLPQGLQLSAAGSRLNGVSKPPLRTTLARAAASLLESQIEAPVSRVLHEVVR